MIVVFDVDGTLCQTSHVDDTCWSQMVRDVLGIDSISTDWSTYPHSTDEAIASALIREHLGEEPSRDRLDSMRDHFVQLLEKTSQDQPDLFYPTPGASDFLEALRAKGCHIAIATGGWTPGAQFKLKQAGLWNDAIPAAYACDAHPREEIINRAITRASSSVGCEVSSLGKVVYIGDGLWDLRATKKLGIGFIGIATDDRAQQLRGEGATHVFSSFEDVPALLEALDQI